MWRPDMSQEKGSLSRTNTIGKPACAVMVDTKVPRGC